MGTPHTSDHTPSAHIAVITTGGTIACTRDAQGALIPTVSGEDVVREVASHFDAEHVRFTVNDVAHLDSSSLTVEDIDRILQAIATALADPTVTGVVVTHGTDSMEETALASDLFHHDPRPVIFTGAMRPADDPSADGPRNLANAAMVAMDPSAREMGSLIVMGTHVLPAAGPRKRTPSQNPGSRTTALPNPRGRRHSPWPHLAGAVTLTSSIAGRARQERSSKLQSIGVRPASCS
ncbi:asparaginase domain-containing protein [Corynebacterium renale]|uniref:asparaginase domain-containing protein n=1 Tax=Corynebacterium renale TaxID=1724 RepID=UPI000AAC4E82